MTEQTDETAKLVAALRIDADDYAVAAQHDWSDRILSWDGRQVRAWRAADLIEAQAARIAELEAERDALQEEQDNLAQLIPDAYDGDEYQGALVERFVRDATGHFTQLAAERDALAAENAVLRGPDTDERDGLITDPLLARIHALAAVIEKAKESRRHPFSPVNDVDRILSAAPSDILAERDAEKWDEGFNAGYDHIYNDGAIYLDDNPYRTKQGEQSNE